MAPSRWHSKEARLLCIATGIADPAEGIRKIAANLIDLAGFSVPPFDPEVLASMRSIASIRRVAMPSAGRLVPTADGLIIEVNNLHSVGKQNLTINHEISHTLMPSYTGQFRDDASTGDFNGAGLEEELLCDIGGAAMLLDPRWLRGEALTAGPSVAMLLHVANLFGASLQAAAWQLASIVPWRCAFIFWELGLRKADQQKSSLALLPGFEQLGRPEHKWRVKSCYASASFGSFVPRNQSTDNPLVLMCCDQEPITFRRGPFKFHSESHDLYCENYYIPYSNGLAACHRIITLVINDLQALKPVNISHTLPLEVF